MALAGLLTRIRSGTQRGRRRRRIWRRRRSNYRSRPKWKRPTRRQQDQQTSTINGQSANTSNTSASGENRLRDNATDSAPQVNNDFAEYVQSDDTTMRDTRARASRDPPGRDDSTNVPCGTSSFKLKTNPSEKCLLTASGLTQDSGYAETSVNSMNSHIHNDTVPVQLAAGITALKGKSENNGITTSNPENIPHHVLKTVTSGANTYNRAIEETSDISGSRTNSVNKLVLDSFLIDHNVQEDGVESELPPSTLSPTQGFEADIDDTDSHVEITESESIKHAVSDAGISTPDCDGIFSVGEAKQGKCSNIDLEVYQRVKCGGVVLEKMAMTPDGSAVVGSILVRNECYEKHVAVRHSSNGWKTFEDTPAEWVESVAGGIMDRFNFRVELPDGSYSVEMAFSFNEKYWDNNDTKNYIVSCTIF